MDIPDILDALCGDVIPLTPVITLTEKLVRLRIADDGEIADYRTDSFYVRVDEILKNIVDAKHQIKDIAVMISRVQIVANLPGIPNENVVNVLIKLQQEQCDLIGLIGGYGDELIAASASHLDDDWGRKTITAIQRQLEHLKELHHTNIQQGTANDNTDELRSEVQNILT